jgi:hypothetical protein
MLSNKKTKYPNNLRHYRLKQQLTQQDVLIALDHTSASRLSARKQGADAPLIQYLLKLPIYL